MNNLLIIADYRGWAFEKIYNGLKKYSINWNIEVLYQFSNKNIITKNIHEYDLILYLCDFDLTLLQKLKLPRNKVILAIRSNVINPIYNNPLNIKQLANTIAVSNQQLFDRFSKDYDNVYLLPGGVDTDKFIFVEKKPSRRLSVGWAGSRDNFGSEYRGLDILENACKAYNVGFNPALREIKYRNQDEMIKYYSNEIDIYADISIAAGRQNGLIEAGSCGCPIISTNVGITPSLITRPEHGVIVERNLYSIISAIEKIVNDYTTYSRGISNRVRELYSWEIQTKLFEKCFDEVLKNV